MKPYLWFIDFNRNDGIDVVVSKLPSGFRYLNHQLARTQNGRLRWCAASMGAGAAL